MTLSTDVRINWPVNAERLLNHVTQVAGGDPATVARHVEPGCIGNRAGQGLRTLAWVRWSEQPLEDEDLDFRCPPALVVLMIDNPYGGGTGETGRSVQANEILPAVSEWLDAEGVPRDRWWWEDETAGTFHPGWFDVRHLNDNEPRPEWTPVDTQASR